MVDAYLSSMESVPLTLDPAEQNHKSRDKLGEGVVISLAVGDKTHN